MSATRSFTAIFMLAGSTPAAMDFVRLPISCSSRSISSMRFACVDS